MSDCNFKLINVDNMHSFNYLFHPDMRTSYISLLDSQLPSINILPIIQCFMKSSDTETLFHSIIDHAKETPILNLTHSPRATAGTNSYM